ncbi:MAG: hypothetical protein R2688_10215 [Fimbriimonadaceae bacterium]
MNCRDCHRFDPEKETCKDGKLNPLTYEQASETLMIYGIRAICIFNDHRESLIERRTVAMKEFKRQSE